MSQAYYGGYAHDINSVCFNSYTREHVAAPSGYNKLLRVTVGMEAKIIRPTHAEIMYQLGLMRFAYSVPGQPFAFYDDDGILDPWSMSTGLEIGGVNVVNPVSHQEIKGSHGTNFLKCQITLQGDYQLPMGPNQYISFQETVTFTGSGRPLKVRRTPATGKPFKQTVSEYSWYMAPQTGTLVQAGQNPQPMDPIWPQFWDGNEGDESTTKPGGTTTRGFATEWSVSWAYQFSSPDPFTGQAHTY